MRKLIGPLTLTLILAACSGGDASFDQATDLLTGGDSGPPTTTSAADEADEEPRSAAGTQVSAFSAAGQKVIVTGEMQIQAANTRETMDAIVDLVRASGGFVASAQVNPAPDENTQPVITLTLRIPAGQLADAQVAIRDLADRVVSETLSSQDVSEEYVDIEARLRNLRLLEEELRALLAEVRQQPDADPGELLRIFNEISSVRGQIEQLEGRQRYLDDRVALSTLTITIRPVPSSAPLVDEAWSPATVLREAVRALMAAFQAAAEVAIWLAVFALPLVLLVTSPLWIGFWVWRRNHRKHPIDTAPAPTE